jgi:mono/diheme cytochrome c family protein
MKRTTLILLLGLAFVTLTAAGASAQTPAEKGKAVFDAQHCSLCHSVAGKGNPKGVLDGMGSKLTAAEIKEWLTEPAEQAKKANADRKPAMKSFKTLPPADLDALVAFVLSLKK